MRLYPKILRARKRRIERRLAGPMADRGGPVQAGRNVHYEVSAKTQGIGTGGMGAFHLLSQRIGLVATDQKVLNPGLVQQFQELFEALRKIVPCHKPPPA